MTFLCKPVDSIRLEVKRVQEPGRLETRPNGSYSKCSETNGREVDGE